MRNFLIMGVLNVTPDSFSDGGRYFSIESALIKAKALGEAGADIIDIGGESTRPGAPLIDPLEEQRRVLPIIAGLRTLGPALSVDTRNSSTMRAAVAAGATIVNDVSALQHDSNSAAILAELSCRVVLMHMRGTPTTMQSLAQYSDVAADVTAELSDQMIEAERAGIARSRIILDPGLGFAKTGAHNIALLQNLEPIRALGCPILIGASRKRFIGDLADEPDPARRDAGSLAAHLFALQQGAHIIRTHNVAATVQAVKVWRALTG